MSDSDYIWLTDQLTEGTRPVEDIVAELKRRQAPKPNLEDYPDFARLARHLMAGNTDLGTSNGSDDDTGKTEVTTAPLVEANVVTSKSKVYSDVHYPVIDLDIDAALIPSSTKGHFHLMIDKPMPWGDFELLLKVLERVGIIEPGYYGASVARKHTTIRVPWNTKEKP